MKGHFLHLLVHKVIIKWCISRQQVSSPKFGRISLRNICAFCIIKLYWFDAAIQAMQWHSESVAVTVYCSDVA